MLSHEYGDRRNSRCVALVCVDVVPHSLTYAVVDDEGKSGRGNEEADAEVPPQVEQR